MNKIKMLILIIIVLLLCSCSKYICVLPMYDDTYFESYDDMKNYCDKVYYYDYMPYFK